MALKDNLAYDYARFSEEAQVEAPKVEKRPQIQEVKKSKAKVEARKRRILITRAITGMLVIVLTLSPLLYTRVVQTELNADYNNAVAKLNSIKGENARLQVKLEEVLSTDSIEQYAREELKMEALDSSKVEYINFNKQAKAEVIKTQNVFDIALSWMQGLFE